MQSDQAIPNELAPCGVFCGACPSFGKTCLGCAATSKTQDRTSKWGCKIRRCCYEEKALYFCLECEEYPCTKQRKKLLDSHPGDDRFQYRHELPQNFKKLQEMGMAAYLKYQQQRWTCPDCGGRVVFYDSTASNAGKNITPHNKKSAPLGALHF